MMVSVGSYTMLVLVTCYTCTEAIPVYNVQSHPKSYLPRYVAEFSGRRHLADSTEQESLSGFYLRIGDPAKSFVSAAAGRYINKHGHPVFLHTLKKSSGIFLPKGSTVTQPFPNVIKKIYGYSLKNWKNQQKTILSDLRTRFGKLADKYLKNTEHELFLIALVQMYTDNLFYSDLNTLLRTENTELQTSLGSLGLMLNVALLQWPKLSPFQGTTYRGMGDGFKPYVDEYKSGMSFAWTFFISSSRDKSIGCNFSSSAIFVIDNAVPTNGRPRQIDKYSVFPGESEVLHPISSIFRITNVEKNSAFCPEKTLTKLSIVLQKSLLD